MPRHRVLLAVLSLAAVVLLPLASRADTLIQFDGVTSNITPGNEGFPGQSFITPSGGPWDDITFNFYNTTSSDGIAAPDSQGTLFLLSKEYSGIADDLSTTTPGYLSQAVGDGSIYQFLNTVQLNGNTTYYVYLGGDSGTNFDAEKPGTYANGDMYYTPDNDQKYAASENALDFDAASDAPFQLDGDPVGASTPLPSTMSLGAALMPLAFLSLTLYRRRAGMRGA